MTELRRGNWSTHELVRLREMFPRAPIERVARLLRRSVESVRRQATAVFVAPLRTGSWTPEEDDRLRMAYGAVDLPSIALVLARSQADVTVHVDRLRAARRSGLWSDREVALLKQLYGSRSDADLEVCLSRSAVEIRARARELCLAKDKGLDRRVPESHGQRMSRWRGAEVAELRKLYPHVDNLEIARALGRSVAGIANKAHQLGLSKSPATLRAMGRSNVSIRYRR